MAFEWPKSRRWLLYALPALAVVIVLVVVLALLLAGEESPEQTQQPPGPPTMGVPSFLYEISVTGGSSFRPRGATIADNKVYVADSEGGRVAVLELEAGAGAALSFIPLVPDEPGEALDQPPQPTGVAALADGSLAVADSANGRIWKVGRDGSFLGELVDSTERERSELGTPVGIWATASEVFVTDVRDHALKVFTHSGRFLRRSGEQGFRPAAFDFPNAVAAVSGGTVYVADSNNSRVQVLDRAGDPVALLEAVGEQKQMRLPRALAFDRFGRLHVVDTFAQAIYVFRDNEFQLSYGLGADNEQVLKLPEGLAISEERIVISDSGNRRLLVYSY